MNQRTTIIVLALLVATVIAWWLVDRATHASSPLTSAPDAKLLDVGGTDIKTVAIEIAADTTSARWQELEEKYQPPNFTIREFGNTTALRGTWAETQSELFASAASGDPAAQYAMYRSSHRCYRAPFTEDDYEAKNVELTKPFYDATGDYVTQSDYVDRMLAELESDWRYCADSDKSQVVEYNNWLIMAASSGYLPAMVNWGVDYPGDEHLDNSDAEDLAMLEDRERQYIEMLEVAKEMGSIDAASKLASAYLTGNVEKDPKKALANLYASAWFRLKYENNDRLFRYFQQQGAMLPAYEYTEAIEEGRSYLGSDQCCIRIPKLN